VQLEQETQHAPCKPRTKDGFRTKALLRLVH
jgi:hypothetical protein